MNPYLQLLRLPHCLKNVVIFLPLIFGGGLLNGNLFLSTVLGFVTFCGVSSVVYIFNDILDADKDRKHQTKCNRPIASGKVSVRSAIIFALVILIVSILFGIAGFKGNLFAWLILAGYVVLNIGYSLGLKNIPLLDICIIAAGFFLRVVFGSCITDIAISKWLFIMIIVISLYLSLYKRSRELKIEENSANTRAVLKVYSKPYLDKCMILCLGLIIVFYSLWCIDSVTLERLGENIIWTIPLVLIICLKYQMNEKSSNQDPISIFLKDKGLLGLTAVYGIIILLIIYGVV